MKTLSLIFSVLITSPFAGVERPLPAGGNGTALKAPTTSTRLLARRKASGAPDTLEIHAFKVKFQREEKDNSLTTGDGWFDFDTDSSYSLDPPGSRASAAYWQSHFEFARNYFRKVSGGRLEVEATIYPQNSDAYELDEFMIHYNRTAKQKEEKQAEFDSSRTAAYLEFIRDAVLAAAAGEDSPFARLPPASPNRHRVYMILHAGASRLLDGGTLGTLRANTPGDFLDIFIPEDAFAFLGDVNEARSDTAGIVLNASGLDTLKEIMVVSETASQDGLNWGINGILVNQIARQIGMPTTYDVVKGISRLGSFDLMDFAGYNAGSGFLPVQPSAWIRSFMGWAETRTATAFDATNGISTYTLVPAGNKSPGGDSTELLRIPITDREYLLVEYRRRSTDGSMEILLDGGRSVTVPGDSLGQIFLDSTCSDLGKNCEKNRNKASGIITGVSSYDAALPASGLAVWHVNEWVIEQYLRHGFVNAWLGDTLRDHYQGISLVEADGVLSVGKEFQDQLGQPAFDYGSGSDLLPHIRVRPKTGLEWSEAKSPKDFRSDTIRAIVPGGYSNVASSNGGKSLIALEALLPTDGAAEHSRAAFSGDSILTFSAPAIVLKVHWNGLKKDGDLWPRRLAPATRPQALLFADDPREEDRSFALAIGDSGRIQLFDASGTSPLPADTLYANESIDSLVTLIETPYVSDSAVPYAVHALGGALGNFLRAATRGDSLLTLLTLHKGGLLLRTRLLATGLDDDSQAAFSRDTISTIAVAGPISMGERSWFSDSTGLLFSLSSSEIRSYKMPKDFSIHDLAACGDLDGDDRADVVLVGNDGRLLLEQSASEELRILNALPGELLDNLPVQRWTLTCSDFNRDGNADAFVLGNFGSTALVDLKNGRFLGSGPRNFDRGILGDPSSPALGDLDGDGFPEAVFTGNSTLWAVDSSGFPKAGFPFRYTKGLAVAHLGWKTHPPGLIGSSPLILDVDGDENPEILSATPTGLIFAVDAVGKAVSDQGSLPPLPSGEKRGESETWPLATGSTFLNDSLRSPIVHLAARDLDGDGEPELLALSEKALWLWHLPLAKMKNADWTLESGNVGRSGWLDPALLNEAAEAEPEYVIRDFFAFPNPLRSRRAGMLVHLGAEASSAHIRIFDISGLEVRNYDLGRLGRGRSRLEGLDLGELGSDIYAVELRVQFDEGPKITAWDRLGIIR